MHLRTCAVEDQFDFHLTALSQKAVQLRGRVEVCAIMESGGLFVMMLLITMMPRSFVANSVVIQCRH